MADKRGDPIRTGQTYYITIGDEQSRKDIAKSSREDGGDVIWWIVKWWLIIVVGLAVLGVIARIACEAGY